MDSLARMSIASVIILLCSGLANGDYIMSLSSEGESSIGLLPGETFELDIYLASDADDEHNSAICSVVFSLPDLIYHNYIWADPYETGTLYDDSKPHTTEIPDDDGVALTADTLAGPGYDDGVVDIELSNVVPYGEPYFGTGLLASLLLAVPDTFPVGETVTISLEPDTFANGFSTIPTMADTAFELHVIPEPASLVLLLGLYGCLISPLKRGFK